MQKSLPTWVLPIALAAGAAAVVLTVFVFLTSVRSRVQPTPPTPPFVPEVVNPPVFEPYASTTPDGKGLPTPPTPAPVTKWRLPEDTRTVSLDVKWTDPIKVSPKVVFANLPTVVTDAPGNTPADLFPLLDENNQQVTLWEKGVVKSGPFKGSKIYYFEGTESGMDIYTYYDRYMVSPDGREARFLKNSFPRNEWQYTNLINAPSVEIALTPPPSKLTLSNGRTISRPPDLYGNASVNINMLCNNTSCPGSKKMGMAKEGYALFVASTNSTYGNTTANDSSCLVVYGQDGTSYTYVSALPSDKVSERGLLNSVGGETIQWAAPYHTTTTYVPYTLGGCGFHNCTDLFSDADVGPMSSLVQAGTTADGPVYVPKNMKTHALAQSSYDAWMQYTPEGEKPSYAAFLKQFPVPIFFWKDAFGRWVRYIQADSLPMAECGKPVVYLYPETTTNVSVKLPSFIRVTKSEPTYPAQGWNVVAQPNGQLTMKDGAQYGSLFWEGVGVNYARPSTGFVVKDGEVDSFLTETLAKYGLNEVESREFRDFWVPRMTGAKYYRVSFLTDDWSKAAPLFVSPKPQTNIRIFMDWQKLSAPISMEAPKIATPSREGFTLVEWGGTLWK